MNNIKKINGVIFAIILVAIISMAIIIPTFASGGNNSDNYVGYSANIDPCSQINVSAQLDTHAAITILTHGQNGSASSWSNDGKGFAYDQMSMIEQLRENIPNSNVYVAKNIINHVEMIKLGEGDYSTKVSIPKITETDKHSIIVFESSSANTNAFHDIAYEELHKLVDKVIFDYKHTTGSIPKINLIAHSRGGILNMMYANDHPQLIDSIFSLGTPYNGSNIGSLGVYLNDNFDAKIKSAGDSAKDIVNVEKQAELRANWEQTLVKNPAINAYALGGIMNVNAFYDLINSAKSKVGETGIINSLLGGAEILVGKIESYPLLANGLIDILNIFQNFAVFIIESIVAENADNNSDVQNEYLLMQLSNIVYDVLDSFKAEFNGEWYQIFDKKKYTSMYADDGMVEIGSQLAQGFSGFTRYVKMYDNTYEHKDKLSTGTFLAGHNYEPRDPELIKYVIDRIDMVSDPIFELTREGNGLSVLGVKNNVTMPNVLSIPNDIAGVPVKCIRADAFNNIGGRFNNVTELRIPATVNKIEFGAIIGLGLDVVELNDNPNFIYQNGALLSINNADGKRIIFFNTKATNNTYAIPSNVKGLDAYSFYNAKNLSSIVLHSDLEYIEVGTFKNAAIASVTGASDRLYYIAEEAFEGTPYLLNSNFVLVGQSLIKYNGNELSLSAGDFPGGIKSIAANAFFGSAITSVVLPNSIEYIGVQAFMNSSLKNIVLGNNILSISERAFANCYQLEEVTIEFNNANRLRYGVFSYCGDASIIVPKQYEEDFISAESLKGQISNIESRTVTVRFDTVGGEVVDQMSVDFGSILSGMPTPIKTGYTFDGWYASSEYQGIKYANGEYWDKYADTTLFARWTANEYLLSFNHDGTSITTPIVVIYDAAIGGLPIPIKGGNTFAGWYNSSDIEITKDTIWKEIENVTVNARWIKNTYMANFDLNGGIGDCNSVEVVYGNVLEFDYAPVKRGNIFKGWSFSESPFSKINSGTSYNWTNDITLIACWELIEYTISYDLNGVGVTNDNNNVYTVESEEILLLNAARFGYLFLGWYVDGVKVTKIDADSIGNKNLKAEWDGVEVGVILNSNEGTLTGANEIDLEFGSIFELTVPIRSGHYFDGWYIGDKKYTDKEGVSLIFWDETESQTLVAKWIKESYEIKILNNGGFIWLDENGDFSSNKKRIPYGTEFTGQNMINFIAIFKVTYGYREGMIFEHFHANAGNNDLCEFLENGNNDITHLFALGTIGDLGDDGALMLIYPKWQRENHTIYFDEGASSISVKYGETIQLPNKSIQHYVFNGWKNTNGNIVNWITMPDLTPSVQSNGSTELATSKIALEYNISYELYGGINNSANINKYTVETAFILLTPTRPGYDFKGWFRTETYNGNEIKAIKGDLQANEIGQAITLHAKWDARVTTVKFDANGGFGNMQDMLGKTGLTGRITSNSFTKAGYEFIGWMSDANCCVNKINICLYANNQNTHVHYQDGASYTYGIEDSYTLHARWREIDYTITYNLNGGSNSSENPNWVTVCRQVELNDASKLYHTFNGWYKTSNFSGNRVTVMPVGTTSSQTLYAKFTPNKYAITYSNAFEHSNPSVYTYGDTIILKAATRFAYRFDGWFTNGVRTDKITPSIGGNLSIEARWLGVYHNVTTAGTYTFNDKVVIVDFSKAGVASVLSLNIGSNVEEITFMGGGVSVAMNISIKVSVRNIDLVMRLRNVSITSQNGYSAIDAYAAQTLLLICEGSNRLYGSAKIGVPSPAVRAKNITIVGDSLEVFGGNAVGHVNSGIYPSYNGGVGIDCQNYTSSISVLKVTGGIGAIGREADVKKTMPAVPAKAKAGKAAVGGYIGHEGITGYEGGKGGVAINSSGGIVITVGSVTCIGGSGGAGGTGGKGGKGGVGGEGADGVLFTNGTVGGNGGRGGSGGRGGKGGDGADAYMGTLTGKITAIHGNGGNGGWGGSGGEGGDGGLGGWRMDKKWRWGTGNVGAIGGSGAEGIKGASR